MEKRIRELMETQSLSASKFAEAIGVQRSNISHILSGRNKPSLELINKILDRYPEVSTDWLLLGKGPVFDKGELESSPESSSKPSSKLSSKESTNRKFSFDPQGTESSSTIHQQPTVEGQRRAVKIVVFYSDQTFEEFHPGAQ
jgi:transcriptional regulator with XRE-family HTH domain